MTPDPRARVKEIAERHEKDEAVAESNFGRDTWEGEMHQDRAELLSIVEEMMGESVSHEQLRELVDHVWNVAFEDQSVPSHEWADKMIAHVFPERATPRTKDST